MAKQFQKRDKRFLGIGVQGAIKGFFGGNAVLSIALLVLICLFLGKEAFLFFPDHHRGLQLYRKSGQEYVDLMKRQVEGHAALNSLVAQAYFAELDEIAGRERGVVDGFGYLVDLAEDEAEDEIDAWAEAREELDDVEEEALAEARNAEAVARAVWQEKLAGLLAEAQLEVADPYGRLQGDDWNLLKAAMREWDPVEETPPPLVTEARTNLEAKTGEFEVAKDAFAAAIGPLRNFKERLRGIATEVKKEAEADLTAAARKSALEAGAAASTNPEDRARRLEEAAAITVREEFPFAERTQPFYESKEEHARLVEEYASKLAEAYAMLPRAPGSRQAESKLAQVRSEMPEFLRTFATASQDVQEWRHDKPYRWTRSIAAFFFGKDWVTNSSWHDFFGLLPLFAGSLMISVIALVVAVPFAVGAAVYVNQLARPWEQSVIKPAIEFVQAIPSVVLGFFGIMVLGTALRELSQVEALSWVPGFPMAERLNILNAGLLLGLMAVPTIFTLCEDALNNVPRAFGEASLALGASKLQTVMRIIAPAAISGILAAVLLGFGRVIGETMVVLLVAGNKIAIPDFSEGLGVVTQPAHTMTGIIAQETGEVDKGSLHWRALFMVGLILFVISLFINWFAQRIMHRFRLA
jgi:phosphate transport system permease protein